MSATDAGNCPERRGRSRTLSAPLVVVAVLAVILAGLGLSVAVVAALATGVRAAARGLTTAAPAFARPGGSVTESMQILTSDPFGPRYTNPSWTVHVGETVTMKITSYDDGPAPPTGVQATMFEGVSGTIGGTETVAGKVTRWVPNDEISHTFTVLGLGLNLPIPAAPTRGSVTVVARFVPERTGTFVWQCYAPCGSGSNSMGGPMSTDDWMEGRVTVVA